MQLQQVGRRMDEVHARGLLCFVHVRARLRDGRGRAKGRNQLLISSSYLLTMMDDHNIIHHMYMSGKDKQGTGWERLRGREKG